MSRSSRAFVLGAVTAVLAAGCSRASSQPGQPGTATPPAAGALKIDYEKFTLANGLDVILSEDHRLPLVAVNLWYHVGPANEVAGRTGFAHLFEHMMFQGSKHVAANVHFKTIEAVGGSDFNGTTDFDRTNYFETVPADHLETALWLESDRMGYLLDELDQTKLWTQQGVVRNERRQSVENQPYGIVEEEIYHQLFPKGHPYYASVIGSHADIQAAKLEDVKAFFKQFYAPSNASLVIVGDFNKATTRSLVEKYFGPLKRGADVPKREVQTPSITTERRAVVKDQIELPRVYMAWLTSPIYKPGDADADVTSGVLGGGKSSRLYKVLVYDKQIAQDVSAQQQSLTYGSVFTIQVTARPGHTPEELEKAIDEELNKLRDSGPDAAEVDRARNVIETRMVEGLERFGSFEGVANRLNTYNHFLRNPGYLADDIQRYRDVTPASVKAFAQQQLAPNARVVVHAVQGEKNLGAVVPAPPRPKVAPGTGAEAVNADEAWRKDAPKPGQSSPIQLPTPTSFQLANGLTVFLNARPGLPVVAANLVVKTGSGANPAGKPGLASFTAAMLDQGTASRSALQLADQVAQLGASLQASSTMDSTQTRGTSLRRNFEGLLDVIADVNRHPAFPAQEMERQRASRLGGLAQQREAPSAVANAAMFAALYGPAHPYGYLELGTEASNKAMTRDDLQAFWSQNFVPNNAALIVSGQITEGELRPLVEKAFGDWARGTPVSPAIANPVTTSARLVMVDKPGAPQTELRVSTIGAPRSSPDYEAMRVMNEELGGLFSSRINLNLREQHAFTYGAGSQFVFRRTAGPFLVYTGVETQWTAPAVSEIFKEVRRMRDTPMKDDELAMAKDSLIRSMPSDFQTSDDVTATTASIYVYDLGLDYFSQYRSRLTAVTTAQAKAAAEKYLVPEKLVVVAVGDRSKINTQLEALKLGSLEVRNADASLAH
jgi:zinc protease